MSVPNLKRIALFVQKLLGGPEIMKLSHVIRGPKFRPAADPLPGAQDRQNLISWRWSLPAPTDPVWWRSMHAISSYRGNRHRPPARPPACHKHAHRQDRLQYTPPLSSAQCNEQLKYTTWGGLPVKHTLIYLATHFSRYCLACLAYNRPTVSPKTVNHSKCCWFHWFRLIVHIARTCSDAIITRAFGCFVFCKLKQEH